ncbi:MAG: YceI family protein [Anaerolineales bacterium]|nr:YceI family protein [Anaerolineales bacterium]
MSWQIDLAHSHINFSVRHMMISTVRGTFDSFSGTVEFDPETPAATSVNVSIDAASINTREEKRDEHLRSGDFLDVANFPAITFVSKRVEPAGADSGKLIGDLTIHGVTREVVLDVDYHGQAKSPWGTTSAGFSASTKIKRDDFGLTWNVALETGGWLVGNDIKIEIEVEVVEQVAAAA